MAKLDDLPPDVVDLISGYLDKKDLLAASLSLRAWFQAYKRRCCEILNINLLAESCDGRLKVLKRWDSHGFLKWVRHLHITDSGVRSPDGRFLLEQLFSYWMPNITGLRSVLWDLSGKSELGEAKFSALPPGVRLNVVCEGDTPTQAVFEILDAVEHCDKIRSLAIAVPSEAHDTFGQVLKKTLLGCSNLTALKITANESTGLSEQPSPRDESGSPFSSQCWTVEGIASLPALRDLNLSYSALGEDDFALWAEHGDWTKLKRLTSRYVWVLENLAGRSYALESLSVCFSPTLLRFLESQSQLLDLTIIEPKLPIDNDNGIINMCGLLALPFGATLRSLSIRPPQIYGDVEVLKQDLAKITKLCPNMETLDMAISREQYHTAVNFFCWLDYYIQAVIHMPKLRRICLRLPRVIAPGTVESPVEITTIASAAQLGSQIAAHGKLLQEVRIIASMVNEVLHPDFADRYNGVIRAIQSSNRTFTFLAQTPQKDWDAQISNFTTRCPELEQAEEELLRGQLSRLTPTGEYTAARRVVDDMSTLVYAGTIVPKRKIRPMPVWLTPEQEQDRREGPPGPGRRAKRAVLGAFNGFVGSFRPPFTETSPRTALERAQAREVGFGGRPGWSKSSLATRIVWRR